MVRVRGGGLDAVEELRSTANFITTLQGGQGAVREVIELILRSSGKWPEVVQPYSQSKTKLTFLHFMRLRIFSAVTALASLVVAYWLYAQIIVPLVEPAQQTLAQSPDEFLAEDSSSVPTVHPHLIAIRSQFPKSHWTHTLTPTALMGPQATLLFAKHETTPDGAVKLSPCVIMFYPKAQAPGDPPGAAPAA